MEIESTSFLIGFGFSMIMSGFVFLAYHMGVSKNNKKE